MVAGNIRRHHRAVRDGVGLRDLRDHGAAGHLVSDFDRNMRIPFLLQIKGIHADTAGDVLAGLCRDLTQRPLNTIKDIVQDARAEDD